MGLADVSAADITIAIKECDDLGREEFRNRYGFGRATGFLLVHAGRQYDSKAIVGVAHEVSNGYALGPKDFSGGEQTVVRLLRRLGFTVQPTRSPNWTRDEIILACEIVVDNDWHWLPATDRRVLELSRLLQQADIHPLESRAPDFRNLNGVARKTADIATHHPDYAGKPTNGNQLDSEVLQDFLSDPGHMLATASAIREALVERERSPLNRATDLDIESGFESHEGRVLMRRHLTRERDPKLRNRKIAAARRVTGRVACEACGFDFAQAYGERGMDFIECHHRVPLHVSGPTKTRLDDLVLLCSNCHRIIHRRVPWLTFEQLSDLVRRGREGFEGGGPNRAAKVPTD
ncbi:MAG: HNH endonuclease [Catenulispora sp.]